MQSLLVHGAVRQGGIPQAQEIIVPLACVGPGDMPDSRGAPESAVGALLCGAWVQGSWGQGVTQHMALTSGGQAIRVGAQAALMMSGGSLTQILADGCDVWKCLGEWHCTHLRAQVPSCATWSITLHHRSGIRHLVPRA